MTFRCLSLDTGTATGWAVGDISAGVQGALDVAASGWKAEASGTKQFASDISMARFFCDYEAWLKRMLAEYQPHGIIFESPLLSQNLNTARKLLGICALIQMLGPKRYTDWLHEAKPSEVRKHFCGNSPRKRVDAKAAVIAACRQRGWPTRTEDEADALALWSYSAVLYQEGFR